MLISISDVGHIHIGSTLNPKNSVKMLWKSLGCSVHPYGTPTQNFDRRCVQKHRLDGCVTCLDEP